MDARAKRRSIQLSGGASELGVGSIKDKIAERDTRDATRQTAPMKVAADAETLDTSDLSLDEVICLLEKKCEQLLDSR